MVVHLSLVCTSPRFSQWFRHFSDCTDTFISYLCCVCALLCPLQKAKATTKEILAEAGKHSFAEQAMFDKVLAAEPHTTTRASAYSTTPHSSAREAVGCGLLFT